MKIAALYARVSTGRQEKEATIESQIAEVEEKIKKDGNVLGEKFKFIDNGWSGDNLVRPDLDRLRDLAVKKEFEVIYVWDRDRLSRKYAHQEVVIEELEGLGVEIVDLHSVSPKTAEDKILVGFKGLFAEYERVKIAERMRRGKIYKAKSGKVVHGPGPYGYSYILKTKNKDGYYKIDEYESNVVCQIFTWVAEGGLSIREVVKKLKKLGIKPRKSKRGVWNTSTLGRLLRRRAYIGTAFYNRSQAVVPETPLKTKKYKKIKKTSRRMRPEEDWIKISVPSILDKKLFNQVQNVLTENAYHSPRNKKFNYLLTGLVYCNCGSRMVGEGGSGKHHYYRCADRIKCFPLARNCFARGVNVKRIDNPVWDKIKNLLTEPELLRRQAERWLSNKGIEVKSNLVEAEVKPIKDALKNLDNEEKRYVKLYGKGLVSFKNLKEIVGEMKMKRRVLEGRLAEIESRKKEEEKKPSLTLEELCQQAPLALKKLLEKERKVVLRKLVDRIVLNENRTFATIRGHIPIYAQLGYRKEELRAISRDSWVAE